MRISDWSSDVCSSDLTLNRDILPTGSELPKLPIGSELPKPPTPGAARRGEEASRRHEIQPAARLSRRLPGALAGGDGIGAGRCGERAGGGPVGPGARGPARGDPARARRPVGGGVRGAAALLRSEEHTSELQSLMRISYAVFRLKKK